MYIYEVWFLGEGGRFLCCPLETHLQLMVAEETAARRSVDWISVAVVTPVGALFLSFHLSPFTDTILLASRVFYLFSPLPRQKFEADGRPTRHV